jgi:transposase
MKLKRVGVDLAKRVYQVHGVDEAEQVVVRKTLTRQQFRRFMAQVEPSLVGMEACGSSHYWARELAKMGHTVRLMAPQFVKPYVKRNKNDARDAEAICEALSRPTMRYVTVKSAEQQAMQSVHRVRQRVVKSRTALVNELHGLLGEFGIVIAPLGVASMRRALPRILEDAENGLPGVMRELVHGLYEELCRVSERMAHLDGQLKQHGQSDERVRRIQQVEGIGPVGASAAVAQVGDARQFLKGRDFASWLGIVPRQHASGGKERLGAISKRGDAYLRTLLIHGARAVVNASVGKTDRRSLWIAALVKRRNKNVATVALANKNARIVWAMLVRGENYRKAA